MEPDDEKIDAAVLALITAMLERFTVLESMPSLKRIVMSGEVGPKTLVRTVAALPALPEEGIGGAAPAPTPVSLFAGEEVTTKGRTRSSRGCSGWPRPPAAASPSCSPGRRWDGPPRPTPPPA